MLQVRLFCDSDMERLENEINQFLAELDADAVVDIRLSESETGWTALVLFKI